MTPRQFAQDHQTHPEVYKQHRDLRFFITPPAQPAAPPPSPEKRVPTPAVTRKR